MNKKIIWGVIVAALLTLVAWSIIHLRYTKLDQDVITEGIGNGDKWEADGGPTSGWKTYVFSSGNMQISYPSDLSLVTTPNFPIFEFGKEIYFPQSALKDAVVHIFTSEKLPEGEYVEINGIGWTKNDTKTVEPGEIDGQKQTYIRRISYGFCETGCFQIELLLASPTSDVSLEDSDAQTIVFNFVEMIRTFKYPITN